MPIKNINYKDDPLYNEKITNSSVYDEMECIWIVGEHCKNCDDCKERDGVIKTYKGWEEIGMPFSKILACAPKYKSLDECDCEMLPIQDYGLKDTFGNKYEVEYFDMDGNKVKFDDENQITHRGYWHADNTYRLDDNNKRYIIKDSSKIEKTLGDTKDKESRDSHIKNPLPAGGIMREFALRDRAQAEYDAHPLRKVIDISQIILIILVIGAFVSWWFITYTIVELFAIIGFGAVYLLFMMIVGYYIRHGDDRKQHILHKLLSKDKD